MPVRYFIPIFTIRHYTERPTTRTPAYKEETFLQNEEIPRICTRAIARDIAESQSSVSMSRYTGIIYINIICNGFSHCSLRIIVDVWNFGAIMEGLQPESGVPRIILFKYEAIFPRSLINAIFMCGGMITTKYALTCCQLWFSVNI